MHSRWLDLLAALGGAAFVGDARTLRAVFVSDGLVALSGRSAERWMADPPLLPELLHPDDRPRVLGALGELGPDGPTLLELRLVGEDGLVHRCRAALRLQPNGQLQALLLDITSEREAARPLAVSFDEQRRAQGALVQRERLAALAELAAVIAHEVRNPLGAIYGSLGSLRKRVQLDGEAALLFDILQEESARLNRLTVDLLDWVRPVRPELRLQPLAPLLERALVVAQRGRLEEPDAPVSVEIQIEPTVSSVLVDEQLVSRALVNVLANAFQSMPHGGRLRVRARTIAVEGERWLSLAVSDTGAGISKDVIDRIFEPFVTTRATGAGLGLALAKRIVDGHGGVIDVHSKPGKGATFTLRLPLALPS